MRSSGEILKNERSKKGLSLTEISQSIKIREEVLQAIEKGEFEELPPEVYLRGLVKNYAQFLGLDMDKVLAFFRRDYTQKVSLKKTPPQPLSRPLITWTPSTFLGIVASLSIVLFLAVLFWQYQSFTGAPLLLVSEPLNEAVLNRPFVNVVGKTDKDASIRINGEEVRVDENGVFQTTIQLEPGKTNLRIVAKNKLGKESVVERIVTLKTGD